MSIKYYEDGKGPSTPWGCGQYLKVISRGVAEVGTAGHGGIRVSRGLALRRMKREILECARPLGDYFWFEEDCAYMLVVLSMPELFNAELIQSATSSVKSSYPDEYTVLTGKAVAIEESYVLQERRFIEETRELFVGKAAWGDWADGVPEGMVRVLGRRESDGAEREFFVSKDDYASCGRFGYVFKEAG